MQKNTKKENKLFFLGIGAEKAGTSWLHNCLNKNIEVNLPIQIKELHFFDEIHINTSIGQRLFSNNWYHRRWRSLVKKNIINLFIRKKTNKAYGYLSICSYKELSNQSENTENCLKR
jgi:hypothetical protein